MHADLSLFFGRFHPLIVHLPIGILLFAALLEVLALVKKSDHLQLAIQVSLFTGGLSAILAAGSGYALSGAGGYENETLFWHQWLGISVGVLAFLAWWVKQKKSLFAARYQGAGSRGLALTMLLLIGATGHLGGNLTHGSTYLTAYMPRPLKTFFALADSHPPQVVLPTRVDSVLVFKHLVQPLLQAKCLSCHNPDKARGGLNLASQAGILKGGKGGPAVVPGDVKESELIRRITLPQTSSKFMPANNLPPLSPVEVSILKWWVAQGAGFKNTVAGLQADDNMQYLLAVYLGLDPEASTATALPQVPAAGPEAVLALKNAGIIARPVSENSNLLDVSFVMVQDDAGNQRQEQLKKLLQVKDQVYWLDISNCGLGGEDLKALAQLRNLTKLNLQKNKVSDPGLEYLRPLKNLEYLNAYQNPLSDKGLQALQQLPALKKLNLWQTGVTEKGVAGLTQARQGLKVHY